MWAAIIVGLTVVGCSKSPTLPAVTYPPERFAPQPYESVVWLTADTLGLNHTPLTAVSFDPRTGVVTTTTIDSLTGWWTVAASGAQLQRRLPVQLTHSVVNPAGTFLACEMASPYGTSVFTFPLVNGLPDLNLPTLVITKAYYPRWTSDGDSIVCQRSPGTTWVAAANGGGSHQLLARGSYPDWHPTLRRVLFSDFVDSSGTMVASIVQYDLDRGVGTTLVRSTAYQLRMPRYSPDGTKVAYVRHPMSGGDPFQLWVADTAGHGQRAATATTASEDFQWSPSSDVIAFIHYGYADFTLGNGTLWTVNVASGATTLVAGNP